MQKSENKGRGRRGNLNKSVGELIRARIDRRELLKGAMMAPLVIIASGASSNRLSVLGNVANAQISPSQVFALGFESIQGSNEDAVIVPPGYESQVIIRWGDPLFPTAPAFDLNHQTAGAQSQQFGFNCDFVGYFPLPHHNIPDGRKGVLCVNHEYTRGGDMFPGYDQDNPTMGQVDTEIAAHGMTVVEVKQDSKLKNWRYSIDSALNRRITGETPMTITGPAAGHFLLTTSEDPSGTHVHGMFNNCAAGKTPWGTVLTCEENFNQYFANTDALDGSDHRKVIHNRYGLPGGESGRKWERFHSRFDVSQEPNEPFRFGWVVEIDPYDPNSVPKKRTALGRTKHEAATVAVAPDDRVVVYMGDDEQFDYMYKFVSANTMDRLSRAGNANLLDEGILYVALLQDGGVGRWLPLVHGEGELTVRNGFASQADVLVNTRGAADLVGATPMDRPEDIEMNPLTGKVYCVMTNNSQRGQEGKPGPDAANPRGPNVHGHIIELTEAGKDPTSLFFTWEMFMQCGDPDDMADQTFFQACDSSQVSPISAPDNIVFDNGGNLWIGTDGMPKGLDINDGVFACPVDGPDRGCVRQFLSAPVGSEVTGPELNSTNTTMFVAIQHPGEGDGLDNPSSTWPDGDFPRPSVIAVIKRDGDLKIIGT